MECAWYSCHSATAGYPLQTFQVQHQSQSSAEVVEHRDEADPFLELIAADALPVAMANGAGAIVPARYLMMMGALAFVGIASMFWLLQRGPGYWGYGANLLWFGPPKIEAGSFYDIQVQPGDKVVRKRSDVTVTANLVGLQTGIVKLFARYRGASEWEQSPMMPQGTGYEFVFAGLPDSVEYYVQSGPVKSKTYKQSEGHFGDLTACLLKNEPAS